MVYIVSVLWVFMVVFVSFSWLYIYLVVILHLLFWIVMSFLCLFGFILWLVFVVVGLLFIIFQLFIVILWVFMVVFCLFWSVLHLFQVILCFLEELCDFERTNINTPFIQKLWTRTPLTSWCSGSWGASINGAFVHKGYFSLILLILSLHISENISTGKYNAGLTVLHWIAVKTAFD